jgi:hypothetical protein
MHHYLGLFLEAYIVPATFIIGGGGGQGCKPLLKIEEIIVLKRLIFILISVRPRCVYGLLKKTIHTSDYIVSNDRIISKL